MTKVGDCILLSLLWIVASLPLVTIGASTTALYYSVIKVLREESGGVWKSFWHSFRVNFKQSTLIGVPILLACVFWAMTLEAMAVADQSGEPLYTVAMVLLGFAVMWLHYIFSYLARFTDKTRVVLRNSFLICIMNFPRSLLLLVVFVLLVIVMFMAMPGTLMLMFLIPAAYLWLASLLLEGAYQKYMEPEEENAEE